MPLSNFSVRRGTIAQRHDILDSTVRLKCDLQTEAEGMNAESRETRERHRKHGS